MKEIIKIGKLMFSQQSASNLGLNLVDLLIVSYINDFINSGKCDTIIENNVRFYYIAYQKILTDLPIIKIKKRQLLNIVDKLISNKILQPLNKNVGRKKTYFRLNLSEVKNSKYISNDSLSIINPNLPSPETEFYLTWIRDWINEHKTNNSATQEIYNRFLKLIKRISEESYLEINGKKTSPTTILKELINLFTGDANTAIENLKRLYLIVDSARNVGNKYKYLVTILYNEASLI